MFTPETSKHFVPYTDPVTGVVSYLLRNETAPLQKMCYYVSKNWSRDERYFWIVTAFPPSGWMEGSAFTAACIDFETDEIYFHPDIQGYGSCVDQDTGELYYRTDNLILKKGPRSDSPVVRIGRCPAKYRLFPGNMGTHLTFSADHKELCCDIHSGNEMYLTSLDIESGVFTEWHHRHGGWNHAQFNPVDNDLIMFAMEYWQDLKTGERKIIEYDENDHRMRTWTIRRGDPDAVLHSPLFREQTHEWWSSDGRYIYYCDADHGVGRINYQTGEHIMLPIPYSWHAHSSEDDRYFCSDTKILPEGQAFYRGAASATMFTDIQTGKNVVMISENLALYQPDEPCVYHIDPHPRFVFNDKYVAQVTTVTGQVTVAFTPVSPLKEKTK